MASAAAGGGGEQRTPGIGRRASSEELDTRHVYMRTRGCSFRCMQLQVQDQLVAGSDPHGCRVVAGLAAGEELATKRGACGGSAATTAT